MFSKSDFLYYNDKTIGLRSSINLVSLDVNKFWSHKTKFFVNVYTKSLPSFQIWPTKLWRTYQLVNTKKVGEKENSRTLQSLALAVSCRPNDPWSELALDKFSDKNRQVSDERASNWDSIWKYLYYRIM